MFLAEIQTVISPFAAPYTAEEHLPAFNIITIETTTTIIIINE